MPPARSSAERAGLARQRPAVAAARRDRRPGRAGSAAPRPSRRTTRQPSSLEADDVDLGGLLQPRGERARRRRVGQPVDHRRAVRGGDRDRAVGGRASAARRRTAAGRGTPCAARTPSRTGDCPWSAKRIDGVALQERAPARRPPTPARATLASARATASSARVGPDAVLRPCRPRAGSRGGSRSRRAPRASARRRRRARRCARARRGCAARRCASEAKSSPKKKRVGPVGGVEHADAAGDRHARAVLAAGGARGRGRRRS